MRSFFPVCLLLLIAAGARAQWTVINLHPAGASRSYANGVNDGQQVGFVDDNGHASLWSGTSASWVDLHPAGGSYSEAYAVAGGQQVGRAVLGTGGYRAALWNGTAASWVDLTPSAVGQAEAFGVGGGQQVGYTHIDFQLHRAALWTGTAASWVDLHPSAFGSSEAYATDGGQQVGYVEDGAFVTHASLWSGTATSWVDLHPSTGAYASIAYAIGDGQQAGRATVSVGPDVYHACVWSGTASSFVDLHPIGAADSEAFGVSGGYQVGYVYINAKRATLWKGTPSSRVDLHSLLPGAFTSSIARGISRDANFIYVVGSGYNSTTQRNEALMWRTPRPYTLGVRSLNPSSGVPMTVWNADKNGLKNGNTSFDRIYNAGTIASVTAPLSLADRWFERWEKDGVPVPGSSRTISVTMDAAHLIKAIYVARCTLTVNSQNPNSGVPIAVWTTDKNGQNHGSTTFTRVYTQGTAVSLTAPNVVGTSYFKRWNLDGSPWLATRNVTVPMGANRMLTAVYGTGQTLSVTSATPSVTVTVWVTDVNGLRDGTTNFTRLYPGGTQASLTAPAQVGGKPFVRWEQDGVPVGGTSRTVKVTMNAGHTMNVVYAGDTPIAFATNRDGSFEVYAMNPNGGNVIDLTNSAGNDFDPSWSPNGSKIAFVSDRDGNDEIYVMNADGSGQVRLTTNGASDTLPTWSPDGSKIAFVTNRDGNFEIYSMNANGSNLVNLTNNPSYDFDPAWSPSGSKIAFMSGRLGNNEVFVMDSSGANPTNITQNAAHDSRPAWSPNGSQIAFATTRNGAIEIYVMNANGANPVRLTNNGADDSHPAWSSDGSRIAFISYRDGNWEVYVMNANGTNQIRLTSHAASDFKPVWKP